MSEDFSFRCPHCSGEMTYPPHIHGLDSLCPHCQTAIVLNGADGTPKQETTKRPLEFGGFVNLGDMRPKTQFPKGSRPKPSLPSRYELNRPHIPVTSVGQEGGQNIPNASKGLLAELRDLIFGAGLKSLDMSVALICIVAAPFTCGLSLLIFVVYIAGRVGLHKK